MRQFDKVALLEEELHDLRLRLELCDADKKAYVETTQWTIKQNKDEMNKLRINNKSLAEEVSALKRYDTAGDKRVDVIGKLEQRVLDLQKKLDDLKSNLKARVDRHAEIQQNLDIIENPEQVSDDNRQEIIVLENKLDKVLIKYNECTTIRKIYEQIIRALNEERTQFDQQLAAFERSLKQKRQDAQELEQMALDAQHARDTARSELQKFEVKLLEERKQREKEIQRLKEIIRLRRMNEDRSDKRNRTIDEPDNVDSEQLEKNDGQLQTKIMEMEHALKMVKDATGIIEVADLLQKMRNFQQTNEQLASLKVQYELKLNALREQKQSLNPSNIKDISPVDSNLLEKEHESANLRKELADAKGRLDKLTNIMSHVRLGVHQLYEKLDVIKAPTMEAPDKIKVKDETISDAMSICVAKLSHLHKSLKEKEAAEGEIPLPSSTLTRAVLPVHNIRVKTQAKTHVDDDEDEPYNENEVLDRETLKKYTAQMLNARIKSKQVRKKKGKKEND